MRCELPRTIQNGGYRVIRQLSCKHSNQVDDAGFDGPSGVTDLVLLDPHLRVVAALPRPYRIQWSTEASTHRAREVESRNKLIKQ